MLISVKVSVKLRVSFLITTTTTCVTSSFAVQKLFKSERTKVHHKEFLSVQ